MDKKVWEELSTPFPGFPPRWVQELAKKHGFQLPFRDSGTSTAMRTPTHLWLSTPFPGF